MLKNKSGTIAPPYMSTIERYYYITSTCSWVLIAPLEFVIRLTWVSFNLNSYGSYVQVFDNNTDLGTGELMAKYTGSDLPPVLLSTGNIMTIIFRTYRKEDFLASYIFVHQSKSKYSIIKCIFEI